MRSVRAVAVGLFAEVVAIFAFYGIAQWATPVPGRLLAFLFLSMLVLIGVIATSIVRRDAAPGTGRDVATLTAAAVFASLILLIMASLMSLQGG